MIEEPEHRLSQDLNELLSQADGRALTVREIEEKLKGRGSSLLIMLFSVPFLIPNVPGLSTPFGTAISMMGVCIAFGRKPWLPRFIMDRSLSAHALEKIIHVLLRFLKWMERVVKPRMHFLQRWPGLLNLIGVGIASGGLFLLLPLPIPFTNTLPAVSILLLTAGMIERDGLAVLLGWLVGFLAWAYLAGWLLLGKTGVGWLKDYFF